jgi:hypothetical protein
VRAGGRNEFVRRRVADDYDLLVLFVVHDARDLLVSRTTNAHWKELFLTLLGHDARVQKVVLREAERQAHQP